MCRARSMGSLGEEAWSSGGGRDLIALHPPNTRWDFKSHTHVPIQLLKTWGFFRTYGRNTWPPAASTRRCQQDPSLLEAAPAGALRELPTVEVPQLLMDRRHRCLRPWKAPAELCPVSHAKGSSQETESLVPVLKPEDGDHFWKPCPSQ